MSDARLQPSGRNLIGAVLGNYRIISQISAGGMGTVYRGQHQLLGRPAAVKLLKPELTTNDSLVERFVNEARAASAIRHPGIVEIYDFGYVDDGRAYIVMELLDGEPLSHALARGRLSEAEAADIARGIASALKAAHKIGIIHRDLKPDNVFLVPDPDGGPAHTKILDFGIAKLANLTPPDVRFTQTGTLIGTPMYMAPEQARAAAQIDQRADLYSLGCILYEMLVGAPPFVGEGAGEIIAMQMFTPVVPPSQRLSQLSPELEQVVMQLLEKEPEARMQSAGDVVVALAAASGGLSGNLSAPIAIPASAFAASGPQPIDFAMPEPQAPAGNFAEPAPIRLQGSFAPEPQILGPSGPRGALPRMPLHDGRPELPPAKRTNMPIIAGAITVAIAGSVIGFVALRGGSDEPAAVTEPAPPAIAPEPPKPVVAPPVKPPAPKKPPPQAIKTPPPVTHPTPPVAKPPVARPPVTKPPAVAKKPPVTKPPEPSGPVTKPDTSGAVTNISDVDPPKTGPHSTGKSPIEHDASFAKKKAPKK